MFKCVHVGARECLFLCVCVCVGVRECSYMSVLFLCAFVSEREYVCGGVRICVGEFAGISR